MGYTTAPWVGFGGALAAVSGALTGLLFVALSVKGAALAASLSLRSRAAQTLVLFMTSVLTGGYAWNSRSARASAAPPPGAGGEPLASYDGHPSTGRRRLSLKFSRPPTRTVLSKSRTSLRGRHRSVAPASTWTRRCPRTSI